MDEVKNAINALIEAVKRVSPDSDYFTLAWFDQPGIRGYSMWSMSGQNKRLELREMADNEEVVDEE